MTFDEILEEMHDRKLISTANLMQCVQTEGIFKNFKVISLVNKGQIKFHNFKKHVFSLLDHRRMAESLAILFPKNYKLT